MVHQHCSTEVTRVCAEELQQDDDVVLGMVREAQVSAVTSLKGQEHLNCVRREHAITVVAFVLHCEL